MTMPRFLSKLLLFAVLLLGVDYLVDSFLRRGLARYYGLDRPAEVLLIGHSHTKLGIDAVTLERDLGKPVAKYAVNGVGVVERLAMLRHYYAEHPDGAKTVVYDVDSRLFGIPASSNAYRLFYPFIDSPEMAVFLRKQAGSNSEFQLRKLLRSLRYNATLLNLSMRGWFEVTASFKVGRVGEESLRPDYLERRYGKIVVEQELLRAFEMTLAFLHERNVRVILCYVPIVDRLALVDQKAHDRVVDVIRDCSEKYGAELVDMQKKFGSRYELFVDPVHLNKDGQKLITVEVCQYLTIKK